jgi:hypothetical protein
VALLGQVRLNLLPDTWLVPYLSGGFAIAYNNGQDYGPAAAVIAGGGLRFGPHRGRLYGFIEVLANRVLSQSRPAGYRVEQETFSLPVLAGLGLELWP